MGIFDTVTNENRAIATKGTKHVARTRGEEDECYPETETPDKAAPFENYIETHPHLDNGTNTTDTTLINGYRIWINGGLVGDGSNSKPVHDEFNLAKKTGAPYRKEATNVTCSLTVKAENSGVVRTDDVTTQNGGNCFGYVDGSEVTLTRENTAAFYKNACKLEQLDGYLEAEWVDGKAKARQELGEQTPGSGAKNYLEIHNGKKVDFVARRYDTTGVARRRSPVCKLTPEHSIWRATRTGFTDPKTLEAEGVDQWTVGPDLTDVGLKSGLSLGGGVQDQFGVTVGGPDELLAFFRAGNNPPTIVVAANACSGPKVATLVVRPEGALKFGVSFPRRQDADPWTLHDPRFPDGGEDIRSFAQLKQRIDEVRSYLELFTKLNEAVRLSPFRFEVTFNFLDNVSFEIGVEYKRCTRTGTGWGGRPYSPAHIGRSWYFQLAAAPLFYVNLRGIINVIDLIASLAAGPAGLTVSRAIQDVIGEDLAAATLGVTFSTGLSGKIIHDQHDALEGEVTGTATGAINFMLQLQIGVASGSVNIVGDMTGQVTIRRPDKAGVLGRYEWDVTSGAKITLAGRILWKEFSAEYEGPRLKLKEGEGDIPLPSL